MEIDLQIFNNIDIDYNKIQFKKMIQYTMFNIYYKIRKILLSITFTITK